MRRASVTARNHQKGVTLVEMMIVLVLVGIITLVTPTFVYRHQQQQDVQTVIEQYQADSLYAKNYAQYQQKRIYLRIFPLEAEYRVYEKSSQPLFVRPIPPSVCIPNDIATFVHYTPQGTISQGHTIYFATVDDCRIQASTTRKLVMTPGNSVYYEGP